MVRCLWSLKGSPAGVLYPQCLESGHVHGLASTVTSGKALIWGSVLLYSQWGCSVEVGLELRERVWKLVKILRYYGILENIRVRAKNALCAG